VLARATERKGGIGISHLAYDKRKRNRVWMAVRRGSGLVVDERTDLSRGANDDVIATDIRRRGETIMRIVNGYNQKDTPSGERPSRKFNWQRVIRHAATVLAGDFNAHSTRWDPKCQVPRNATFREDVIDENGLEIGNDGRATHHWTREGHEGESVIDLTLANRPFKSGLYGQTTMPRDPTTRL
jgi:endonuclease/exonuclease/phosphatase family metal-dependent hydrolase